MQTGVYNGWIMFLSGWVNFKLYEVGKFYTEIGLARSPGTASPSIRRAGRNCRRKYRTSSWRSPRVRGQDRHREQENYPKQLADLKGHGVNVRTLPEKVRQDWATRSLPGRRRAKESTPLVCLERRCWRLRSRQQKTTATSGESSYGLK